MLVGVGGIDVVVVYEMVWVCFIFWLQNGGDDVGIGRECCNSAAVCGFLKLLDSGMNSHVKPLNYSLKTVMHNFTYSNSATNPNPNPTLLLVLGTAY